MQYRDISVFNVALGLPVTNGWVFWM